MFRIRICFTSCLTAGGLFIAAASPVCAQSFEPAGVIRVSDSVSPAPIPAGSSLANSADCPPGGYGYEAGYGHRQQRDGYRFSPPVKRPIYRSPVSYTKGFSDAWTGNAPAAQGQTYQAPTVYMPTDTTQLGYYYQVVPYWQPKPGAVPPPPIPSQWHTTVGQLPTYGRHPAGVVYGTAPTAIPSSPTPPPWGPRGLPPAPEPAPASLQPTPAASQPAALERSPSSPSLLPIE